MAYVWGLKMKANIASVCFLNDFNKDISKLIADKLDLYYADIDDYLEFNMVNANEVIDKVGIDYLNKLETDSVKTVASFENAFISIEPRLFVNKKSMDALKHSCVVVYVHIDKNLIQSQISKLKGDKATQMQNNMIVFEDYDKLCINNADIVVSIKNLNTNKTYKAILKQIKAYYTKI